MASSSSSSSLSSADARKRFEVENKVEDADHIYKFDVEKHQAWVNQRLWQKEYASRLDRCHP